MALKFGITGMDSATEAALRSAFDDARDRIAGRWTLVPEAEADHVVVDMDSMYGPMSWIRLHAAGKQVIGLTTSPRTQADHHLARPFDAASIAALLDAIAGAAPQEAHPPQPPVEAPPSHATPAPAPADQLPEEQFAIPDPEAAAPPEPAAELEPVAASAPATALPEPAPEPEPRPTHARTFADWLVPGALPGRWKFERNGASVVFDSDARTYHGPAALKALAPLFEGEVDRDCLQALDAQGWDAAATGTSQGLARLQWLGGLLAGRGALLPGLDPQGQYRLLKWPQTEREYPRHFRIATAMMKGPASVADTAVASGVPADEVADFINANLATGYAEQVRPAAPETPETQRGGLLGRLRGR
jgi:hypothetical protein